MINENKGMVKDNENLDWNKIKEGYYSIVDGVGNLKDEFEIAEDKKAIEMIKQIESISDKLYKHIGGV